MASLEASVFICLHHTGRKHFAIFAKMICTIFIKDTVETQTPLLGCDSKKSVWRGSGGILFFGAGHVSSAPSPQLLRGVPSGNSRNGPNPRVYARHLPCTLGAI